MRLKFVLPPRVVWTQKGAPHYRDCWSVRSQRKGSRQRSASRRRFCSWWVQLFSSAPRYLHWTRQPPGHWLLKRNRHRTVHVRSCNMIAAGVYRYFGGFRVNNHTDREHAQFWKGAPHYPGPCHLWWGPEHGQHLVSFPETHGTVPAERSWCLFLRMHKKGGEIFNLGRGL